MKSIDKATRLINYLNDLFVIYFCWLLFTYIFNAYKASSLTFNIIMFLYYLIFEVTTGQTIGKMITKTIVVKKDGTKPSFFNILMRSFWRLIPFDTFSYLFGYELGMHDILSSTKLIKNTIN